MIGGHGWIAVIGLLVLLTAGTESNPGDLCCLEDWEDAMGEVLAGFKTHAGNLDAAPFKAIMETWLKKVDKLTPAELDGLCEAQIRFKCVGVKDASKCECNHDAPLAFILNAPKNDCLAEKEGSICIGGRTPTPCSQGSCRDINPPTRIGVCKSGGIGGTGEGGNGADGAYSQTRVMYAILSGLAVGLLPIATINF